MKIILVFSYYQIKKTEIKILRWKLDCLVLELDLSQSHRQKTTAAKAIRFFLRISAFYVFFFYIKGFMRYLPKCLLCLFFLPLACYLPKSTQHWPLSKKLSKKRYNSRNAFRSLNTQINTVRYICFQKNNAYANGIINIACKTTLY